MSTRYAIITADDFGVSAQVNQAIIQAHQRGILTNASLMVTGATATEAIALAQAHPQLSVGLHLVLGCGRSQLPPDQIPHLVDEQGNFLDDPLQAGLRYYFHRGARQELRQEIRAQLMAFQATGLRLSHVDGHLHHHVNPAVLQILVEVAAEFVIPVIRLPLEELQLTLALDRSQFLNKSLWWTVFGQLRRYGVSLLESQGINYLERVYGLLQTGRMNQEYLLGLIPQIQAQAVEIYTHPNLVASDNASKPEPNLELKALLAPEVKQAFAVQGFQLINMHQFSELTSQ